MARLVSNKRICIDDSTNGPKAKPTAELLLRPPSDRPMRAGNQSASQYSMPPASRGRVRIPNLELNAWSQLPTTVSWGLA